MAPREKTSQRSSRPIDLAPRLLRGHIGRRPQDRPDLRARPRRVADRGDRRLPLRGSSPFVPRLVGHPAPREDLGQAPVDHLDLAERADHDVGRLQVAVDDASGVRIGHRLTDLLEHREEPPALLPGLARSLSSEASVWPRTSFIVKKGAGPHRAPSRRRARRRGAATGRRSGPPRPGGGPSKARRHTRTGGS